MAGKKQWALDPNAGGRTVPPTLKKETKRRIEAYAAKHYEGQYERIDVRFRGVFCYIDAYQEPNLPPSWPLDRPEETRAQAIERIRQTPIHLCRLRFFDPDRWSLAFYKYSDSVYAPAIFPSGQWFGTPEEGFDVGALYLQA